MASFALLLRLLWLLGHGGLKARSRLRAWHGLRAGRHKEQRTQGMVLAKESKSSGSSSASGGNSMRGRQSSSSASGGGRPAECR